VVEDQELLMEAVLQEMLVLIQAEVEAVEVDLALELVETVDQEL
jgi:hypothetical protein